MDWAIALIFRNQALNVRLPLLVFFRKKCITILCNFRLIR